MCAGTRRASRASGCPLELLLLLLLQLQLLLPLLALLLPLLALLLVLVRLLLVHLLLVHLLLVHLLLVVLLLQLLLTLLLRLPTNRPKHWLGATGAFPSEPSSLPYTPSRRRPSVCASRPHLTPAKT